MATQKQIKYMTDLANELGVDLKEFMDTNYPHAVYTQNPNWLEELTNSDVNEVLSYLKRHLREHQAKQFLLLINYETSIELPPAVRCKAITKMGRQCQNNTRDESGYCKAHQATLIALPADNWLKALVEGR